MNRSLLALILSVGMLSACTTETNIPTVEDIIEDGLVDDDETSSGNSDGDETTPGGSAGDGGDDETSNDDGSQDDENDNENGDDETPPSDGETPPPPVPTDKQAYSQTLHVLLKANCAGCHANSVAQPNFASDNIDTAYDALALNVAENALVNLTSPRNSKLARWLRIEHNCFSDDCFADADAVGAEINKWLELTNKPAVLPANDPVQPETQEFAFENTTYEVSKARCAGCHNGGNALLVAFSSLTLATAFQATVDGATGGVPYVDMANPANSRLSAKVKAGHNCGADINVCIMWGDEFEASIALWTKLVTPEAATRTVVGDVNADGFNDYLLIYNDRAKASEFVYGAFSDNVNAKAVPSTTLPSFEHADFAKALGDVNNDGYADFAIASDKTLNIVYGAPTDDKLSIKTEHSDSEITHISAQSVNGKTRVVVNHEK